MTNKFGLPSETDFEAYVVDKLTDNHPLIRHNGQFVADDEYMPAFSEYHQVDTSEFDKDYCILRNDLFDFLEDTQPKELEQLIAATGGRTQAEKSILSRLDSELKHGTLSLLHQKAFDAGYGVRFKLIYYKPVSNLNPEHIRCYKLNRFAVVRQLQYSKVNQNEIDLAIFVNGLPIATIELKNTFTGQRHLEAIKQYMQDRKVKGEKLLEFKRCLVHFAVGTEQIFMTTHLADDKTRFIPFNKCFENQGVVSEDYKTSYLWEDVLKKDSLLDLIQNFIGIKIEKEQEYDAKRGVFKTKSKEVLIFPRYHQRRAVHKLIKDAREKGAGHRYLIQHSAGSGKSYTITWLAFQLASLYLDINQERNIFDCIFVVTDKKVLDQQIQDNIRQFDLEPGQVAYIDKKCTSQDLKDAIEKGKKIIVTTLQKFPVIADSVRLYPDRRYAIIIDEAHSSQTGEDARQMRKALSLEEAEAFENLVDEEEESQNIVNKAIEAEMKRKANSRNISFFAFTATPKDKTIELFCELAHGTKEPFDVYSMEDAIKEGFILNVMKNYMSFKRYYKLVQSAKAKDKEYEKKKTVRLLTSYVDLTDIAIERKARIMIEHFVSQTSKEIEGQARAMLVTRSRLHAVRFKLKFDEIMREMRLPYTSLVAFSGTVRDSETEMDYTENSMNNLPGGITIPMALKMPKYRILIVANKYQTGFDEPLLQTMFVDKKLGDTSTVQTLSRLNRTKKGKVSTFVLDFVNDPEKIREDFQKFYGKNYIEEENLTDPNSLYDIKSRVNAFQLFVQDDVDSFATILTDEASNKHKLNAIIDRVCDNVIKVEADKQDLFRKTCRSYCNLYKFLSQIISFTDAEIGKLYAFLTALLKKLPYKEDGLPYDVLNEVELDSYKIQYQYTRDLSAESGDNSGQGMNPGDATTPPEEEIDLLSRIIKQLNDTYGIELTEEDRVEMSKLKANITSDSELMEYFNKDNSRDDIRAKFEEKVDDALLDFINNKLDLYNKLSEDRAGSMFKNIWFNELYDQRVRGIK